MSRHNARVERWKREIVRYFTVKSRLSGDFEQSFAAHVRKARRFMQRDTVEAMDRINILYAEDDNLWLNALSQFVLNPEVSTAPAAAKINGDTVVRYLLVLLRTAQSTEEQIAILADLTTKVRQVMQEDVMHGDAIVSALAVPDSRTRFRLLSSPDIALDLAAYNTVQNQVAARNFVDWLEYSPPVQLEITTAAPSDPAR